MSRQEVGYEQAGSWCWAGRESVMRRQGVSDGQAGERSPENSSDILGQTNGEHQIGCSGDLWV